MKKAKNILIFISAFLVIFAIGFVIIGILVIQNKYEENPEQTELNVTENKEDLHFDCKTEFINGIEFKACIIPTWNCLRHK